jgi:lysophospholipase L1-like esterase
MVNLGERGVLRVLEANPLKMHFLLFSRSSRVALSLFILGISLLRTAPSQAAQKIVAHYGLLESSLPIADLQNYAKTQRSSPALSFFLQFTAKEQRQALRDFLQKRFAVNRAALDKVLNDPPGAALLQQASSTVINSHGAGVQALRSAAILGTQPDGMSVLSVLAAYPNERIVVDLPKALALVNSVYPDTPTDRISTTPLWQTFVDYQITIAQTQSQPYSACLFGDSISSALGNTFGRSIYNFALGGLSSVSLVEQLQRLNAKNVQCDSAVIAIGANDALYKITDAQFAQNLTQAIALTRQMGAKQVVLLPAFYSTLAASKNPKLAGPIPRVEAINRLIQQVAGAEEVALERDRLAPLFSGKTLKQELTSDGVHLNAAGLNLYRPIILNILSQLT